MSSITLRIRRFPDGMVAIAWEDGPETLYNSVFEAIPAVQMQYVTAYGRTLDEDLILAALTDETDGGALFVGGSS